MLLTEWLLHIHHCHDKTMDFTLDRILEVADQLSLLPLPCPAILVGGTNGKGTTVTCLEQCYLSQGYRVFASISPTLLNYNERLRINGLDACDELFCAAFTAIEAVRGTTPLTFFEFSVLAVLWIIKKICAETRIEKTVALLEIGLGGRLDAFNIVDPVLSIITSIDLDHEAILGSTREAIALEKAGILRAHRKAVCGDFNPPHTLIDYARTHDVPLLYLKPHLEYVSAHHSIFKFQNDTITLTNTSLHHPNLACALAAIILLKPQLPVNINLLAKIVNQLTIPGRFEIQHSQPLIIFDVAHNPAGTRLLKLNLEKNLARGKRFAIFSMLKDKNIAACIASMQGLFDTWFIAKIHDDRAAEIEDIATLLLHQHERVVIHSSFANAYEAALALAQAQDQIIVFGSFHTVSEIKKIDAKHQVYRQS